MTPVDRDEDRDAWLAQALRHAPDANADAPAALSDMILREARAAARTAALPPRPESTGPLQWLASAWDWLARPPVAAGFAGVMVATLVGVMWWDQPLDQTLPRAPEVVSSTPPARAEASPPAAVAAAPAAPAEPSAPKAAGASREAAAQGKLADRQEADKRARASPPADERLRMAGADARLAVAAPAAPPAAFPAAPPAPAPQAAAPATEAPSADRERLARSAPAAKATAEPAARAAADQALTQQRNEVRTLQGAASPALAKARSADAGDTPLATLRAQIAQQPERWRWQRGPGAPQPMNTAVQGWLAELERQTRSHWQANADSLAHAPAGSLRLLRDGVLQSTLALTGSAVWIETPGAAGAAVAALPEALAESLQKALDDATP